MKDLGGPWERAEPLGMALLKSCTGREDCAQGLSSGVALGTSGLSAALAPRLSPHWVLGAGGSAKLLWGVPSWVGMGHRVPEHVAGLEMEMSWR